MSKQPRYPIYVPTKGRSDRCLIAKALIQDDVPFKLVIEPQERDLYAAEYGAKRLLVLPFSNLGNGSIPARNWIKAYATAAGHARHWQIDDNVRGFYRVVNNRRLYCSAALALRVAEDFTDRYENVAISGLNYSMFVFRCAHRVPPFFHNTHVYSCVLVLNSIPHQWRGRYNEDTDICLQVLADGWCTIAINAFVAIKAPTMRMKGGNTDELYRGDGRLRMARALERLWPGVVTVDRRFQRPQHVVYRAWQNFDTPLKLRPDLDPSKLPAIDNYGMKLVAKRKPRSQELRKLVADESEISP
jgi:hypothetical protein